MNPRLQSIPRPLASSIMGYAATPDTMEWIPGDSGKYSKPLRFLSDNRGFVELFRLDQGAVVPPHRHTGEVHAFNLEGSRQLGTGEIIRPGEYVYEPAGNVDTWKVVGAERAVILVVVMGEVEYLGPGGVVTGRCNATTQWEAYCRHCRETGTQPLDLRD
jgi:2,4'-dihydroxyacetophenone dioxygenase